MASAADTLAALKPKKGGKKQKNKGRKVGRNYRWDGTSHGTTKYRARHGIPSGPRK